MKARRRAVHKGGRIPPRPRPLRIAVPAGAEGGKAEAGAVARAKDAVAVRTMEVSERGESGTPFHSDKSEPCSRGLLSDLRHSKAGTRPRSAASRLNAESPARGVGA